MNRRRFLSLLGMGSVGVTNTELLRGGGRSTARQSQTQTTRTATATQDIDVTTQPETVEVPLDALTAFEDTYAEAAEYDPFLHNVDYGLSDTALFIKRFLGSDNETEHTGNGRIVSRARREGDNPVQVAQVAAAAAGAIAQEQDVFEVLEVYLLLYTEDEPNDGDQEPQVRVNQRYQIKGQWVEEFVDDERSANSLLQAVFRTPTTQNRTTKTTTTTTETTTETSTPEEEDDWSFSYDVESDGTLTLIEGGLNNGYTLWAEPSWSSTRIYGVVENISGSTLDYAEVRANLYVNNAVVADALANMRNLRAGGRWRFEALTTESLQFEHIDLYLSGSTY